MPARGRAFGVRIDPVLVVAASLALGGTEAVAPAAMAVAALLALVVLAPWLGRAAVILAALGLVVGAARARFALGEHARGFERARQLLPAPARCAARGRVTVSPTWHDHSLRVEAELTSLDCDGRRDERPWPVRLQLAPDRLFRDSSVNRRPSSGGPSRGPAAASSPGESRLGSSGAVGPLAFTSSTGVAPVPPPRAAPTPPTRSRRPATPPSETAAGEAAEVAEGAAAFGDLARGDTFFVVADLAPVSEFRNFLLPDPRPRAARSGALLSGGALSFELEARSSAPLAWVDRARAHVRERIVATFGERVAGMARALVLGENDLDPDDERAFQRSGLSHLLAVSGTHLILAVLALLRGVEAVAVRVYRLSSRLDARRPVALLGCCLGPLYADFAGGSGSAWRAAFMLCAVLGVRAAGRHVFPSRVLAASLGAGWLSDGLVVFDASFSLSLAATVGLLAAGRRLHEPPQLLGPSELAKPRQPELRRLAMAVSRAALTTLAATLPCVPILLTLSPGLSLASVAANLLAAPIGEAVALPLCLAHALCAPIPPLERGLALVASGALGLIRAVAHSGASVDWLYFDIPPPSEWHQAAIVAGVSACLAASGRSWREPPARPAGLAQSVAAPPHTLEQINLPSERRGRGSASGDREEACAVHIDRERRAGTTRPALAAVATLVALLAIEAATRWQHSAARMRLRHLLRVTALDVGQGDATLVDLPDGRLLLIDGGGFVGVPVDPGERVIVPTLRARRRDRIDILVLTHPHPDHYGGLASVAREFDIGEFWYGGDGPSHLELFALLQQQGSAMRAAAELCQTEGHAGAAVRLLHPCPAAASAPSANDASLVLRVSHGSHAALFVGDAEHWAEQRLIETHPEALDADFLKVGHHGSRTSSGAAFLARVSPSVATISAGIRNRFGHPHPETLSTLAAARVHTLRLDRVGAASWESDGTSTSGATFAPEPPHPGPD